ncbi:MAG: hypothetical protein AAFY20_01625 [Cyanobacteria bacterium J06639_14]
MKQSGRERRPLNIQELAIAFVDLQNYIALLLHHRDPFDRILVAQAVTHSLDIVSADAAFDAYSVQRVWAVK